MYSHGETVYVMGRIGARGLGWCKATYASAFPGDPARHIVVFPSGYIASAREIMTEADYLKKLRSQ